MWIEMETHARLCRLQYALGRVERCPEARCPFWEPGGAALEGRCALDRIDVDGRPDIASWLIRIRTELDPAKVGTEERQVRRLFYRLVDTGDVDGG